MSEIKVGSKVTWGDKREYVNYVHFLSDYRNKQDTAPLSIWEVRKLQGDDALIVACNHFSSRWVHVGELAPVDDIIGAC